MNIALWVVQGLLALVFLMSGSMKAFTPLATMRKKMTWANNFPWNWPRKMYYSNLEINSSLTQLPAQKQPG